jgi:hypothetical protein
MRAGDLRPLDRFRLHGMAWECERQARRTTFARCVEPEWEGYARIQVKKSTEVEANQSAPTIGTKP